jgi:hypothetical protein
MMQSDRVGRLSRGKVLALTTLLLSACAQSPVSGEATVPEQFRGEWNADVSACGTDLSDTRLEIQANSISFWESSGPLTEIEQPDASELTATAELSGEGEVWTERLHFRLSPDGRTLTDLRSGASGFSRRRCP